MRIDPKTTAEYWIAFFEASIDNSLISLESGKKIAAILREQKQQLKQLEVTLEGRISKLERASRK